MDFHHVKLFAAKYLCAALIMLFPLALVCLPVVFVLAPFGALLVFPGVTISLTLLATFVGNFCWQWLYAGFEAELALIEQVGEEHALWTSMSDMTDTGFLPWQKWTFRHIVLPMHNPDATFMKDLLSPYLSKAYVDDLFRQDMTGAASILYSRFVKQFSFRVTRKATLIVLWLATSWFVVRCAMLSTTLARKLFFWCCALAYLVTCLPLPIIADVWVVSLRFASLLTSDRSLLVRWLSWRVTAVIVDIVSITEAVSSDLADRNRSNLRREGTTAIALFRRTIMRAVKVVDDISLPEFIRRGLGPAITVENLQATNDLMVSLGWPVNVSLESEPSPDVDISGWREWFLCGSDFRQGIHNLKVRVDDSLDSLRIRGEVYKRSETYANVDNELKATARYFVSPNYGFPDIHIEDVWFLLKDIFSSSRLTSFNTIIHFWEKKYGLGSMFRDPDSGHHKKLSRKKFISSIGYKDFKKLWARTFMWATQLVPVAAVSVKGEALPARKWMNDKVRTVIGSPLGHYIMSTVFNYSPNHNFAWETTPIKVGMPLNGYWMSWLFSRHSRCQKHWEGDFSEFDSTVSKPIQDVIKAIRKKGFEYHKDFKAISHLIDVTYEQIEHQLLHTTSTGNIYLKGTGLTTGHSSTSMDNSVALTTFYLMAWRELTGLTAREFVSFNELSCYGDDHLLSVLATCPSAWTPKNIQRCMKKWGVTNNLEEKKLADCEFLSKKSRRATSGDLAELARCGVQGHKHIVWHNKQKLIGKLTAGMKPGSVSFPLKRLLSYLHLTAHHPDVYEGIVKVIRGSKTNMMILKNSKWAIPSYEHIVREWYKPTASPMLAKILDPDLIADDSYVAIGSISPVDTVLGALSLLPDVLSPSAFNYGYDKLLQSRLRRHLLWAFDYVCEANAAWSPAHCSSLVRKTHFEFLQTNEMVVGVSGSNLTERVVRNFLFWLYCCNRPKLGLGFSGFTFRRIASLQFMINGIIMRDSSEARFNVDKVLLLALLDFLPVPDWLGFLGYVHLPDVPAMIDSAWHFALTTIWTSVPTNYKDTMPAINQLLRTGQPMQLQAPTGTGKSTAFISFLHSRFGHRFEKLIVVVPRRVLAVGLSRYMAKSYGLDCTAGTHGVEFSPDAKVAYVTPNFLVGRPELLKTSNLFVIDESHIKEPFVVAVKSLIAMAKFNFILASATPSLADLDACTLVRLETPSVWLSEQSVVRLPLDQPSPSAAYRAFIADVNSRLQLLGKGERALVFVGTPEQADDAVAQCPVRSVALSSKHEFNPMADVPVIFSTSVADVGVTIDGLSHVFTMNAEWGTNPSGWKAPSEGLLRQRAGRTGRTRNGQTLIYEFPGLVLQPRNETFATKGVFRDLALGGFPPEVLAKMSKSTLCEAFELDLQGVGPERESETIRALGVAIRNVVPLWQAHVNAQTYTDPQLGPNTFLRGSGSGFMSTDSVDLDDPDGYLSPVYQLGRLLSSKASEGSFPDTKGTFYSCAELFTGLLKGNFDPDQYEENIRGFSPFAADLIFEMPRIASLLESME